MKGLFLTNRGKVRPHNEDAGGVFQNRDGQYLALIADGMGGHNAGDVASKMVEENIKELWENEKSISTEDIARKWLEHTINNVNDKIYERSKRDAECSGMGTTIVLALFTEDFVYIAHVGDSRCYLLERGEFQLVTEDHSFVNDLVRAGKISPQDAQEHPRKNMLTRALGTEENIVSDINVVPWKNGHQLLLCSDGLTNKISDLELASFLNKNKSLSSITQDMVDLANERGGEDNISLCLMSYDNQMKDGDNI